MRRALGGLGLVLVLSSAGLGAHGAPADPSCLRPRCVDVVVPVPPGITVPEPRVRVILPEGYPQSSRRYPVLYLLHGVGDTFATWSQKTDVLKFSSAFPVIIVMPDGGHGADAGWYSDWKDGSRHWETFHTKVLVDYIDRRFKTLGDGHRAVAGLSMGGFGSMSYAARHPELFQAAASFSGFLDTRYAAPASGVAFEAGNAQLGTPDERVWGNQVTDEQNWRAHNPTDRAADLTGVELFLATGTRTPGGPEGDDPSNPGAYGIEFFVFQTNVSFIARLELASVPFHQDPYPGGYHGWPYWQRELHWALPQVVELIDAPPANPPAGRPGAYVLGEQLTQTGAPIPALLAVGLLSTATGVALRVCRLSVSTRTTSRSPAKAFRPRTWARRHDPRLSREAGRALTRPHVRPT